MMKSIFGIALFATLSGAMQLNVATGLTDKTDDTKTDGSTTDDTRTDEEKIADIKAKYEGVYDTTCGQAARDYLQASDYDWEGSGDHYQARVDYNQCMRDTMPACHTECEDAIAGYGARLCATTACMRPDLTFEDAVEDVVGVWKPDEGK